MAFSTVPIAVTRGSEVVDSWVALPDIQTQGPLGYSLLELVTQPSRNLPPNNDAASVPQHRTKKVMR